MHPQLDNKPTTEVVALAKGRLTEWAPSQKVGRYATRCRAARKQASSLARSSRPEPATCMHFKVGHSGALDSNRDP
jgi:hypothetical protein